MITFKQYLEEAIISKWDVKDTSVKKAIVYLNANCKDGLKAIKNNAVLFRGSSLRTEKGFAIIDSSTGARTSRDSNNMYQLMMDNSSALSAFPKRTHSLICTTDIDKAALHGNVNIIIPIDGTQLALADANDFFNNQIRSNLYSGDIEDLSSYMGQIALIFGANAITKFGYVDIKAVNAAFSKYGPAQVAVMCAVILGHIMPFHLDVKSDFKSDFSELAFLGRKRKIKSGDYKIIKRVAEAFLDGKLCNISKIISKYYDVLKDNPNSMLNALANVIVTPQTLNIKLAKFGNKLPIETEVWFSGKAVIISIDMFTSILDEMKKLKMPVPSELYSIMNNW